MDVIKNHSGRWIIMHGGKEVAETFDTEDAAYQWADKNIDDGDWPVDIRATQESHSPAWGLKGAVYSTSPAPCQRDGSLA